MGEDRRQSDLQDLDGRTVVVTGAGGGIGRALAVAFADEGARLVLADRAVDGLDEVADELAGESLVVAADVTSAADVDDLRDAAIERFGAVDVVCNNAGVGGLLGPSWELDEAEWDQVLGVNLRGVVNGIRSFVPTMVAQGRGHVVNTASMAGLLPMPFGTPYVASKHAVVGVTATLRWELAQLARGVSASVLCPGWTRSGIASGQEAGILEGYEDGPVGNMVRYIQESVRTGLSPQAVAARVVRAVRNDEFWILTHEDQAAQVLPHYQGAAASATVGAATD